MRIYTVAALSLVAAFSFSAEIKWAKNYEAAKSAATSKKALIMVDFYTDWCHWCKELDKNTYPDPKVVKLADRFVSLKTDAEKEGKDLAKKYKVNGFPTIVFMDAQGNEWGRIGGYMPPTQFVEAAVGIVDAHSMWPTVQSGLKSKPNDPTVNANAAYIYAMRSKIAEAEAAFKLAAKTGKPTAKAANAIGDYYQTGGKFDTAVSWFNKGDAAADAVAEKAYARVSIMSCYGSMQNRDKMKQAAKKLKELKGAPKEYLDMADQVLKG